MLYAEISTKNNGDVLKIVKEAITFVCNNIDSGIYAYDEKKPQGEGWKSFGIKIIGNRKFIDVGPAKPEPA